LKAAFVGIARVAAAQVLDAARAWLIALCGLIVLLAEGAGPSHAAEPPSAFGRLPAIQSAAVSPDGKRVAMVSGSAAKRILSVSIIDGPSPMVIDLGDVRTSSVRWAGDDFILVRVTKYGKPDWSKYSFNFTRDLIFTTKGELKGWLLSNSPESGLMSGLPVLTINAEGDKPYAVVRGLDIASQALWKVDVATGRGSIMTRESAADWAVDRLGEPRGKIVWANNHQSLAIRPKGAMGWRTIDVEKDEDRYMNLLGYSDEENAVYWTREDGDKGRPRLRKARLSDGAVSDVETEAGAGVVGVVFDPYSHQAVAIGSADDRPRYRFTDKQLGAAHGALSRLFKGRDVELENWSEDRSKVIVRVEGPAAPGSWYLFDQGRKEVSALGEEYPELKDRPLAEKRFIHYRSRDGLELPAYLHLPPGRDLKKLPLIVLPHGGPAARDDGGFDWEAQFYATSGYLVLQPQFRGSAGFGADFRKAGKLQWAGKMQTDLIDGIDHLAQQGLVDPQRVCIVGNSYGGYAALRGATAHPDRYRCAVATNAVTDPGQLIVQLDRRYAVNATEMREMFGKNADQVAAASPAQHVEGVRGPVLLVYSLQDSTVPPEQTTLMRDRLRAAGKHVEVVELAGDDHHLMLSASRIRMLEAAGDFLAKHMPATP
jgi:dipeptidyl aminopeptidase/acylaminoacyl peptidase